VRHRYNSARLTKEEAIAVQEALFKLGYRWGRGNTPKFLDKMICIWPDGGIAWGAVDDSYDPEEYKEIPTDNLKELMK